MRKNFDYHYLTNRAPFGIYTHATFFDTGVSAHGNGTSILDGTDMFLDEIMKVRFFQFLLSFFSLLFFFSLSLRLQVSLSLNSFFRPLPLFPSVCSRL